MGRHGETPKQGQGQALLFLRRSELARDGRKSGAVHQGLRVILDIHREQARSYRGGGGQGAQNGGYLKAKRRPEAAV
ncbi:hypothetical protein C4K05_1205 [Pseudomonas chlororaphis subsp. aureofaciens]|nr:hypothetical protein C4K12_1214 [Pseudomonas chlororaphis subsp. aureofaciens]AZE03346.1 hypothetical protein C4K11_1165 [Pseudomonas chlororaphis subsp. aureofaciens]AZE34231.1 hypothetical protein C4K06_1179 [Pseudomonas chlororaphis subsp. aureofaciens]AZE40564.1 hypothetical protein C4K05_1205 [Pseudomonas chlororaphis subsp. aureofaciens]